MPLQEKFDQIVEWMVHEIRKETFASVQENEITFEFQKQNNEKIPSEIDQERALRFLENIGTVKLLESIHAPYNSLQEAFLSMGTINKRPIIGYQIQILEAFNDIYNQVKNGNLNCGQLKKEFKEKKGVKNQEKLLNDDFIQYDANSWEFFYKGKSIHQFNEGSAALELFKEAFKDKIVKYEFPHNKEKNDKKRLQNNIKNFKSLLQKKLKENNASLKLVDDFFIRIKRGMVEISKCFVVKL